MGSRSGEGEVGRIAPREGARWGRPATLALITFLTVTAATFVGSRIIVEHRRTLLRLQMEVLAEQAAARLHSRVDTRLTLLEMLRDEWDQLGGMDFENFHSHALVLHERMGDYEAIQLMTPDGATRWGVVGSRSISENAPLPISHPDAEEARRRALRRAKAEVTAPYPVSESARRLEAFFPIVAPGDTEVQWLVHGAFRLEPLVEAAIGSTILAKHTLHVIDGAEAVYAPEPAEEAGLAFRTKADLPVHDRTWRLYLTPRRHVLETLRSPWDRALIASGLLLAAGLAALVGIATLRRTRLEVSVAKRRALEAELRQAQKLESLGRLAGGIAHDFNNVLMVISANAEAAASIQPAGAGASELEAIKSAALRGSALTRQILAFARRQPLRPRPLDLGAVFREMEGLLRRLVRQDIVLEVQVEPALWPVMGDHGQVEQVLVNLVVNASDAISGTGRIVVSARNLTLEAGNEVELAVSDSGHGIDPEVRELIFQPFFTAKQAGGTGLGLANVYTIVTSMSGRIMVESHQEIGTTFRVRLPRTEAPPPPADDGHLQETRAPHPARLLLVEDETEVREAASRFLRALGYEVTEAADGQEALDRLSASGSYAAVISDVVMPGLTGTELAVRIREIAPALPILLTSGYASDSADAPRVAELGLPLVPKPWTAESIGPLLRRIVSEGTDGNVASGGYSA